MNETNQVPTAIDTAIDKAKRLLNGRRLAEAAAVCEDILRGQPDSVAALELMGIIRHAQRDPMAARRHLMEASRLAPRDAGILANTGTALTSNGEAHRAVGYFERALAIAPLDTHIRSNLGVALFAAGDHARAAETFRMLRDEPGATGATARLHLAMIGFDASDPARTEPDFAAAARGLPHNARAQCRHAFVLLRLGRRKEAEAAYQRAVDSDPSLVHTADAHAYLETSAADATPVGTRFALISAAYAAAKADGFVADFGVRWAISTNYLATLADRTVHGFDSFEGLPHDWGAATPASSYTTEGVLPETAANVRLHVGLFAETLPGFLAEEPRPARLLHIDCDIYESTKDVLGLLERRIVPGTVIVFDEYHSGFNWRAGEHRAYQEFLARSGRSSRYLGYNPFGQQAAVIVG